MAPICGICSKEPSKYKCPSCSIQTCSLECVKLHKKEKNCLGTVDPAKFLSWKQLSEGSVHVNRDYNFLINAGRHLDVQKETLRLNSKNLFKRQGGPGKRPPPKRPKTEQEDSRLQMIKRAFPHDPPTSIKRKNTVIVLVPPGMSRAMANKTGYDKKAGAFVWSVEWVVVADDGREVGRYMSYRLPEGNVLQKIVPINLIKKAYDDETDLIVPEKLSYYLMNVVNCKSGRSLIPLESTMPLCDALADRIVLEYPTIYVSQSGTNVGDICTSYNQSLDEESEDSSSDSETASSDSDSDSDSDSESDSGSDSGLESDSDDSAPEESSSKPPQLNNSEEIEVDM